MIQIERVTREFDGEGVFDVSLQVKPGEALGLLGPTGAGKSILLRILAGQLKAGEGSARIDGKDCWSQRREVFRKTVYVPMVPALDGNMTGEAYLRFQAGYHGGYNPEKARRMVEQLDIQLTGQCRRMSQENRKKLSLLAGLSMDAEAFLLDEPFNGLAPMARDALAGILKELASNRAAILMSSHVLDDVRRACSHIAIIRKGRLVVTQPVEALSLTRQKVYHITFKTPAEAAAFAAEWEAAVELIGPRAMVAIPASPQTLLRTLARYEVLDLVGGREEAEEGFLRFHGDDIV